MAFLISEKARTMASKKMEKMRSIAKERADVNRLQIGSIWRENHRIYKVIKHTLDIFNDNEVKLECIANRGIRYISAHLFFNYFKPVPQKKGTPTAK